MSARAARVAWHAARDEAAWAAEAAAAIAGTLRRALAAAGAVRLLLSGGTTPAPVYRALSAADLDWARVTVGLVDERDVAPDADGSNERLVRDSLLRERAAAAGFEPLRGNAASLAAAVAAANERLRARPLPVALTVLGMGDDGHTASLFPDASNLAEALAAPDAYVAIDAPASRVAGAYPHRISLTPAGLALAGARLLLIRGEAKRAVFERALQEGPAAELPIRAALDAGGPPLAVRWCA